MELNLDVITLFLFMFQDKTREELIRYLKSQSISGIIIYGVSEDEQLLQELIASESFKCVIVDEDHVSENTSCVTINQKQAQYDVAKALLEETNAKKILYISGYELSYVTKKRLEGMEAVAQEKGIQLLVKYANFSETEAKEIALQYGKDVDAICCASDLMAIGAKKAMKELQIECPICGFDGISLMEYVGNGIYTVSQNFSNISAIAMEELQSLMAGNTGKVIEAEYQLVRN